MPSGIYLSYLLLFAKLVRYGFTSLHQCKITHKKQECVINAIYDTLNNFYLVLQIKNQLFNNVKITK